MTGVFEHRRDAGRKLAKLLSAYADRTDVVVLGLARGGVPVAFEIAQALGAPLDVFISRKLGVPGQPELAMGAIASGGVCVFNERVIRELELTPHGIEEVRVRELRELERRELAYHGERPPLDVRGTQVILADDGLATGATMQAALTALRRRHPAKIIVAVPVASRRACAMMRTMADECICAATPRLFMGVGQWYRDFTQTEDDEVGALLNQAAHDALESVGEHAFAGLGGTHG